MTTVTETPTFDEQWGPLERRVRRASRYCRYIAKSSIGLGPRILVEINWRLGDEVMALPIYEAIRTRFRVAHLDVLCNYPELLEGNPFVDSVNPSRPTPDVHYLLRGTRRDVKRIEHYARQADVPVPDARPQLYFGDWNSPVLSDLPKGGSPLVALAPGASWETKRWPDERWRELGEELASLGLRVIVLGSSEESIGIGVDFTGRTSIRDAAVLLQRADALVCNDSGLMHLGLAAGTKVVALFGPTDSNILIDDDPAFHALDNGRECAGCWNGAMTMREPGVCPRAIPVCMETITVTAVLDRINAAISARG